MLGAGFTTIDSGGGIRKQLGRGANFRLPAAAHRIGSRALGKLEFRYRRDHRIKLGGCDLFWTFLPADHFTTRSAALHSPWHERRCDNPVAHAVVARRSDVVMLTIYSRLSAWTHLDRE